MNDTPQLTLRAIVLSVLLTVVLAAANAYLGLFAGLTVATAIPAAVVSMGVLRLLGRSSVLENNIVATGASAGSSIAAGTVFTMPALVILGHWARFDYWWVFAIIGLGGLLGVLFSVPLRRTLIIDQGLQFPEGVATAELLRAGSGAAGGARLLGLAALAGAVFKLVMSGLRFVPESFTLARYLGTRTIAYVGVNLSPALLGVGYIVGLNIGLVMVAGGLIAWWLFIPIFNDFLTGTDPGLAAQLVNIDAETAAGLIWTRKVRYIGVGAMLVGGLWALWTLRSSLLSGVRSGLSVGSSQGAVDDRERDLPMAAILAGIALFVLPLFVLYHAVVGSFGIAAAMAVIMIVAGFVFSSVSGYMAGLVGSSNNPVSGITISTILFASLVLLAFLGAGSTVGPVAAILIGAVTCSAAAVAGDNLQDLKAGRLLGATPWRQQVMLAIGALAGAAIMAPVLNLLLEAYGIGTPAHAGVRALNAPQATLMAAVAKGIFGGGLPWDMIGLGALVGASVIVFDLWLKRRGGRWRAPVLAVAVGIYLPLEYTSPIFLGGLLSELVDRWHARHGGGDPEEQRRDGLLFSSGLIAGEAIVGVLIAIPIVVSGDVDVLALPAGLRLGQWIGLAGLAAIGAWLYRSAARRPASA
ncbi:MAG: oligopeptide transporter, OPT family [Proteobacteria bacterium]|nr:oligopeptide transporter, OPT family [Pseudomonadota bacterium]